VILRDNEGNLIVAKSTTHMGNVEPVVAEAFVALEAIKLGHEMGFQSVAFVGDAKMLIDAVKSEEPNWSRIGHFISDIRSSLEELSNWTFSFVHRERNRTAHELANMGKKQTMDKVWTSTPPNCI
jgi:ribonuclease HI